MFPSHQTTPPGGITDKPYPATHTKGFSVSTSPQTTCFCPGRLPTPVPVTCLSNMPRHRASHWHNTLSKAGSPSVIGHISIPDDMHSRWLVRWQLVPAYTVEITMKDLQYWTQSGIDCCVETRHLLQFIIAHIHDTGSTPVFLYHTLLSDGCTEAKETGQILWVIVIIKNGYRHYGSGHSLKKKQWLSMHLWYCNC